VSAAKQASEAKERPIIFSGPMVRAILEGRKTQTRRVVKPQPTWGPSQFGGDYEGWNWTAPNGVRYTFVESNGGHDASMRGHCPYGRTGDRLWVREAFRTKAYGAADEIELQYLASIDPGWSKARGWTAYTEYFACAKLRSAEWVNRPSIFLPRWASRITLEVTGVRVERLQEIADEDIRAEGIQVRRFEYWWDDRGPRPGEIPSVGYGPEKLALGVMESTESAALRRAFRQGWNALNAKRGFSWESNPFVWVVSFRRLDP
jgi:hypothetical protein